MRIVIILIVINLGLFYMGHAKRESMKTRREFISKSNATIENIREVTDEQLRGILERNKVLELRRD